MNAVTSGELQKNQARILRCSAKGMLRNKYGVAKESQQEFIVAILHYRPSARLASNELEKNAQSLIEYLNKNCSIEFMEHLRNKIIRQKLLEDT